MAQAEECNLPARERGSVQTRGIPRTYTLSPRTAPTTSDVRHEEIERQDPVRRTILPRRHSSHWKGYHSYVTDRYDARTSRGEDIVYSVYSVECQTIVFSPIPDGDPTGKY